ncbi:MAG: tRNA (5-methylaminomethyl-2-thiouridine)(34)-methyltransferase MnmD [Muribaculaceae bacterium]|nr:tRNA (5-methylaminomethyl-2-thiouridine)(34)-methyltransferase MnmD [Muribaculaceae bacterium]
MRLSIETTSDGSPTLYRPDIDEHYHSVKGAVAESLHVYINSGWRQAANQKSDLRVFEVGFGTGLNAALTAKAAQEAGICTQYCSVELFPLPVSTTELYSEALPEKYRDIFSAVNNASWDRECRINDHFIIRKINDNLLTMQLPEMIDVVYFDAFAPEKQPEMWDESIFRKIYDSMTPGGILTTYCAKGVIRRMLADIGFKTERLPGPPAGKREILRALHP